MKTVLIVDDYEQNLYMLQVLLESHGYTVSSARNGQEALDIARNNPPDLIITDILMPVMDGFALCRQWKGIEELKKIPFIFYTATYIDPKDGEFALNLGADLFLVKPMDPELFMEKIEQVISSHEKGEIKIKEKPESENEEDVLRTYNQRLINKLEQKMEQLEISNQRLAGFFEASSILTALKPKDELIRFTLETISKLFNHANTLFYSFDQQNKEFILQDSYGIETGQIPERMQKISVIESNQNNWMDKVCKKMEPVFFQDLQEEFKWLDPRGEETTFCVVPMVKEGMLTGIILLSHDDSAIFTAQCTRDLVTLTNNMSIALRNAELFHQAQEEIEKRKLAESQIQQQLQRLSSLHKIDLAITSSFDIEIIFKVFLEQVIKRLGVDAAAICLFNDKSNMLEYHTIQGFRSQSLQHVKLNLGEGLAGQIAIDRQLKQIDHMEQSEIPAAILKYLQGEGFVTYFGTPAIAKGKIQGVLEVFHRSLLQTDQDWIEYLATLAGQLAISIDSITMFDSLQKSNIELNLAYDNTLEGWAKTLELRDGETVGHSRRVTEMTIQLAQAYGLSEDQIVGVRRGVLLHDIGKIAIPDKILLKPGPLTDDEWEIMRKHPVYAYEMLSSIGYLRPALDIPYCHHEKWDGSGYPRGLKGEEIPLTARIFSVVDVWDALNSDRPYRKAWPREDVIEYIKDESGKHFDPQVVPVFLDKVINAG